MLTGSLQGLLSLEWYMNTYGRTECIWWQLQKCVLECGEAKELEMSNQGTNALCRQ